MNKKSKILIILMVLVIGIFNTNKTKTYEQINPAILNYENAVKLEINDSYDKTKGKYGEITYNYTFVRQMDDIELKLYDDFFYK